MCILFHYGVSQDIEYGSLCYTYEDFVYPFYTLSYIYNGVLITTYYSFCGTTAFYWCLKLFQEIYLIVTPAMTPLWSFILRSVKCIFQMSVYLFFWAFLDSEGMDTTNISRHPLLCYLVTLKRKWCYKEPKRRRLACSNDRFSRCWGIRTCTLSESCSYTF